MLVAENTARDAEQAYLEGLQAQYERNGYRFVIHPRRPELPEFFASYEPDAIATNGSQNIAIEVKSHITPSAQQSIQKIRKLFEGRADWAFKVAYVGKTNGEAQSLPSLDPRAISEGMNSVEQLVEIGHLPMAFVAAWSLLEAALNSVGSDGHRHPRTPGTVVQTLAMNGFISDDVEKSLRSLIALRNRVVHGDLTAAPSPDDVRLVLDVVGTISQQSPSVSAS
ncbi:HepT-like ribonuclease domain-containing protein [Tianweitania populi]|uniref:REase AHJR-like domain-containing protein n=1 Tax=Tianweitania populi TaxID=1607949 RepID=A0A8J3GKY1_9HYPH|nr:HepT-like ribonuclease domain-containing protein [Tianweitania populi]GHD19074.1 hypothetical protein GCM10016234_30290 [Tianweitania populi]